MRIGISGDSGYMPVQAARTSAITGGVHSGSAGAKRATSSPAAENKAFQSGAGQGPFDPSRSGGTAVNPASLPSVSNRIYSIPGTSKGGSLGLTRWTSDISRGAKDRGLERYQNAMTGGRLTA